jgi:multiple sugar transport system substrate-binding protein
MLAWFYSILVVPQTNRVQKGTIYMKLKGITWNHSRGYVSVVATAQRFMEMNPGVEITWEKRSLQAFADYPIDVLAEQYDLLIIDHPWAGFAADKNILISLEKHLPEVFLDDQAANSVGKSHESYNFNGMQSALAIDAATPIATYRHDLFEQEDRNLPNTWEDLLSLAKEGKVAFSGIPLNALMDFYMLCVTQGGEESFFGPEKVVSDEIGIQALEQLRELTSYCTEEMFNWDPIAVNEVMSTRNDIYYCPFAYGYSNYSRKGYSKYLLKSADLVSLNGKKLISTLGGTGIAISNRTRNLDIALDYAMYTASPEIQKTLFFENGGQPGHRETWLDAEVNRRSEDFFINTLPTLDRAYLRPRYENYFHFQDQAGDYIQEYNRNGGDPKAILQKLNQLYRESKRGALA